ncbi:hypothetical protein [Marnyiella aurantia]|uniref:hypothetical protein n=1 Tax=Marnyiella aurantia TaxID=2758037 RepID=UPI0035C217A1
MDTIPYGLCATKLLDLSFGINSPFVPGLPAELPPPEQDTVADTADADNNKRNILFMLIFIIKP